ncbi:hypothetical protein TMatcc_010520 [Talaromyces marneffei ATCC 18224]
MEKRLGAGECSRSGVVVDSTSEVEPNQPINAVIRRGYVPPYYMSTKIFGFFEPSRAALFQEPVSRQYL